MGGRGTPKTLLRRLDDIGRSLERTGQALALIGLRWAGIERARLDDYSDLDSFATAAALAAFMPGYDATPQAAVAILELLEQHFHVNPHIKAAILRLCAGAEVEHRSPCSRATQGDQPIG